MAEKIICGAMTRKGTPCRWARSECPAHQGQQPPLASAAASAGPARAPLREARPEIPLPAPVLEAGIDGRPWVGGQDLRGLGWWLIGGVLDGEMEVARAAVVSTVMRVLAQLGPAPVSEEAALREAAFRGRLMNGFRPQSEEEWVEVARYLDDEALAEMRRWPSLLEGDGGDGDEPLFPGDGGTDEIQVSVFRDDQDRG